MTDESDRPKLTVVAENTRGEIDRKWAEEVFERSLLELAANIIRVVRGAGKPHEVIAQCDEVVKTAIEVREKSGRLPSPESVANTLLLEHERIVEYDSFWAGRQHAVRRMVKGSLQIAASRLLNQQTQILRGESEMEDGFRDLERLHEELRKQREAEARAARARAAPQKKPTRKKAKKTKSAVRL